MIGAPHARQALWAARLVRAGRGAGRGLEFIAAGRTRKPLSFSAPDFRQRGPAAAKIPMAEFSDFQCPACRSAEMPMRQMLALYGDERPVHVQALPAGACAVLAPARRHAAECAGQQGKFWPYRDHLYDKQDEWTNRKADDSLAGYAKKTRGSTRPQLGRPAESRPGVRRTRSTSDMKEGDDRGSTRRRRSSSTGSRFVGGKQCRELRHSLISEPGAE